VSPAADEVLCDFFTVGTCFFVDIVSVKIFMKTELHCPDYITKESPKLVA
jgi:hypothetical protein